MSLAGAHEVMKRCHSDYVSLSLSFLSCEIGDNACSAYIAELSSRSKDVIGSFTLFNKSLPITYVPGSAGRKGNKICPQPSKSSQSNGGHRQISSFNAVWKVLEPSREAYRMPVVKSLKRRPTSQNRSRDLKNEKIVEKNR